MLKIVFFGIKLAVIAAVGLMAGQVRYKGKRGCDHFGDVIQARAVQQPLKWISGHFDFREPGSRLAGRALEGADEREIPESEKARLSGLLKNRR
ncbi:MAG: hypothetical protein HYW49_01800 [Deltaproteobacteria bacterium]|nr:hypothetical protein [Deltaproteobacteria bacterium]